MEERWLPIPGFEGIYEVSNLGRVKHLHRSSTFYCGTYLKLYDNMGYHRVDLYKNKKRKKCLVHRLVAEVFIPNPHVKPFVNHINGNRANNKVPNLEWVTSSENNIHSLYILGRKNGLKRIRCVETGEEFMSVKEAAIRNNICPTAISQALNGKAKTSAGYHWVYVYGAELANGNSVV